MFEARNWNEAELAAVNQILGGFPERHVRYNEGLSQLVREDFLSTNEKTSLSAAGHYRTRSGSMVLYNPAFSDPIAVPGTKVRRLDFTLWALIGFSLFTTLEVRRNWAPIMYPRFDRGSGASPLLKVVDRELLNREMRLSGSELYLDPNLVSLDRSFAYCYACYALSPENLLRSFPNAYEYLKNRIFARREFRNRVVPANGGSPMLRV